MKILLIGLFLAGTLGMGFYFYKNSQPASQDEEMIAAPLAQETSEREDPIPEEAAEPEPMAPEPASTAAPKEKVKTKATAGHFEMSNPTAQYDEADMKDNPGYGKAREKRLSEIFKGDQDLARSVKVNNIFCRVDTCIVEAESKDGDADRFQSLMYALTRQHPWIGNKIDVTTPDDNPRKARFVYFQETPK